VIEQLTLARSLAPGDDSLFVLTGHAPIDDPAEALDLVLDDSDDEDDIWSEGGEDDAWDKDADDADPASEFALSEEEVDELRRFIASRPATAKIMSLEAIDGFYSALVMDPDRSRARESALEIFGSPDPSLYFDSDEQGDRIVRLLARHLETIARRLDGRYMHSPLLEDTAGPKARVWAGAFLEGVETAADAWEYYISDEFVGDFLGPLATLSLNDDEERDGVRMTADVRADLVTLMPMNLLGLYSAVRLEEQNRKKQPAKSTKVGRNEPCPCGSGKKYKKCCGAAGS
jgi:uncharacterized protein